MEAHISVVELPTTHQTVVEGSYRPPARARERVPHLDGVRCLAVVMVVLSHAGGDRFFALGLYGVTLFFVLSAYLITGILLSTRGAPLGRTFATFYARRAIRIFPAYFVLLAVLYAVHAPTMRHWWAWHALYLSNWLIFLHAGMPAAVGHFWTLAIEEQFYLTWPALVLLLPVRQMGRVSVGLVTLAVVTRWYLAMRSTDMTRVLTPTVAALDAFVIGALLAYQHHAEPDAPIPLTWCLATGLALAGLAAGLHTFHRGEALRYAVDSLGAALVSVWGIDAAVRGRLPQAFAWRPVRFAGTISYGIYLWHIPVLWAITEAVKDDPIARETARGGWAMLALVSSLTFAIACVSWYALERPLNSLKRCLPYRRPQICRVLTNKEQRDSDPPIPHRAHH